MNDPFSGSKEGTAGIVARTIDTSPGQPGRSISRFPARSFAHVQADQNAKLVSILRTRSAQIGVQPATINMQLDGQIGSKKEELEGDKGG
jgi:hypothetical protein